MFNTENYGNVPSHLLEALIAYGKKQHSVGSFLGHVLENNLFEAICRADPDSLAAIKDISMFVHWELPVQCHGSKENVRSWISNMNKPASSTPTQIASSTPTVRISMPLSSTLAQIACKRWIKAINACSQEESSYSVPATQKHELQLVEAGMDYGGNRLYELWNFRSHWHTKFAAKLAEKKYSCSKEAMSAMIIQGEDFEIEKKLEEIGREYSLTRSDVMKKNFDEGEEQ
jgi:hypothetical protein